MGLLNRAEVDLKLSQIARTWLVGEGWITPEMDQEIDKSLIFVRS
jgi:hypothetical protein